MQDDHLLGDRADNIIIGEGGADKIEGRSGDDTLYGAYGDDRLFGGMGEDILYGGAGDDILVGGWQGDRMDGGAGDDVLIGGTGADIFSLNIADAGHDVVTDFEIGVDKVRVNTSRNPTAVQFGDDGSGNTQIVDTRNSSTVYMTLEGVDFSSLDISFGGDIQIL